MPTNDVREGIGGGGDLYGAGKRGVDGLECGGDVAVFGDHGVDLASVVVVGEMGAQRGPEIVVLGGVVVGERVPERGPARAYAVLGPAEVLDLGRGGFQAGQIAPERGVDG